MLTTSLSVWTGRAQADNPRYLEAKSGKKKRSGPHRPGKPARKG